MMTDLKNEDQNQFPILQIEDEYEVGCNSTPDDVFYVMKTCFDRGEVMKIRLLNNITCSLMMK